MLRGSHAGMALAARLVLEQLTEDDSRAVAAAAAAALGAPAPGPPAPPRPELALSATVIDLGRLPQHSQSPERRVRISNAGGGDLNARAVTSSSWLRLHQAGDELVVATDTSATGDYEGTVTVDSDGGTSSILVRARVDPAPLPASETAATTHPEPAPETPAVAGSGPHRDPATAASTTADAVPPLTETVPAPAGPAAGQAVTRPDVGPAQPLDDGGQRATPPPRGDHPPAAPSGPGPGEKTPQASRPRRAIGRRTVIIAAAIGITVIGVVMAIMSGAPGTSSPPASFSPSVTGSTSAGPAGTKSAASSRNALRTAQISGVKVLTSAAGFTVYWFGPDTATSSKCTGVCAFYWLPVKGPVTAGADVTGTLGTITRSDGSVQATYNGHPLYTYAGDTAAGQAKGNGLNVSGGVWHEVIVSGAAA
jgi:predicted lipoprotein with Yx(FWY)xxD motif